MALIKCPECEQSISDKAPKCPKYGYPIQEYLSSKTEETQAESVNDTSVNTESSADIQQPPMQKKSKKKFVIALLAVCVEDGQGLIETYEDKDKDPSIKYRPIGYLGGTSVDISDMKVKYTDSDYFDWSYFDYTSCDVLISVDMNNSKNGLLVFDIINETNNEIERNMMAAVINGKVEYNYYYVELPYKARDIDVSIVPKLFCESAAITKEDYMIEKAYTAEKSESSYSNRYSGRETLDFADYADGFVFYTRELKEGGNKKNKNVVENVSVFLHDGECILTTYDSVDEDETILMPKYEFNIIGYITWKPLEKGTI